MILIVVLIYQQNDFLCSIYSFLVKYYVFLNYCYWLMLFLQIVDDGVFICEVVGGYMGYIDFIVGLLNFINDGLDNYWR